MRKRQAKKILLDVCSYHNRQVHTAVLKVKKRFEIKEITTTFRGYYVGDILRLFNVLWLIVEVVDNVTILATPLRRR